MSLEQTKSMAIRLLNIKLGKTDFYPVIATHPFFNTAILFDNEGIFEADNEPERFKKILSFYENRIINAKRINDIIVMLNKPYIIMFIYNIYINHYISDNRYFKLLMEWWPIAENINHDANVSQEQLLNTFLQIDKKKFMCSSDYKHYSELPETITIYRGTTKNTKDCIKCFSWSQNINIAKRFSKRGLVEGYVYKAEINKTDVFAYTNARKEEELIVNYKKIKNIIKL